MRRSRDAFLLPEQQQKPQNAMPSRNSRRNDGDTGMEESAGSAICLQEVKKSRNEVIEDTLGGIAVLKSKALRILNTLNRWVAPASPYRRIQMIYATVEH